MVQDTIDSGLRGRLKPRGSLTGELKPGTAASQLGQGRPGPKCRQSQGKEALCPLHLKDRQGQRVQYPEDHSQDQEEKGRNLAA